MSEDKTSQMLAMAQERQNRHIKFGAEETGVPLATTLIQDVGRQIMAKNDAAAMAGVGCALDELSKVL